MNQAMTSILLLIFVSALLISLAALIVSLYKTRPEHPGDSQYITIPENINPARVLAFKVNGQFFFHNVNKGDTGTAVARQIIERLNNDYTRYGVIDCIGEISNSIIITKNQNI